MTFNYFLIIVYISNAYAVSSDCPNMINLGLGVGINTLYQAIWTQLNGDCCTASGVTCVGQRVTDIVWSSMNLNGSINGTALPDGLVWLYLDNNQINGSIPSTWPSGLQRLYFYDNQLTGSIPRTWPSGLLRLYLNNNQLTGLIPSTWPSGLQRLYLHNNQLTKSIPSTWPSGLLELYLYNNFLTGDISLLPLTLQYLYLGMQGDTKLNRFTGKLVLNRPQFLYINNNWITNVVVYDPSLLSSNCDLSYNPLLANSNINNLTRCTKTGLYDANLLPNTIPSSVVATTTLVTITSLAMQSTTETSLLRKSPLVSVFTKTTTVIKETDFIFVAHESIWRLSWSILVKLLINAMILGVVVAKGPFKRELKAKFSLEKKQTSVSFEL